jgi:hypothetical protein
MRWLVKVIVIPLGNQYVDQRIWHTGRIIARHRVGKGSTTKPHTIQQEHSASVGMSGPGQESQSRNDGEECMSVVSALSPNNSTNDDGTMMAVERVASGEHAHTYTHS